MGENKIKPRKYVANIWANNGIWYWQVDGSNGRIMACCPATGYSSKRNAMNALNAARESMSAGFYTEHVHGEKKAA